jgi:hypothetical protein
VADRLISTATGLSGGGFFVPVVCVSGSCIGAERHASDGGCLRLCPPFFQISEVLFDIPSRFVILFEMGKSPLKQQHTTRWYKEWKENNNRYLTEK